MRDADWLAQFRTFASDQIAKANLVTDLRPAHALVPRELTRKIWIFWAQGWDDAPTQSKLCLASWKRHNPDWKVIALDDASVGSYVDLGNLLDGKAITSAARSDLLRMHLLAEHGGVWVDASTYCSRSLTEWLLPLMQSGFFGFARPGPDRLLSTWFLAAEPGHHIVTTWCDLMRRYWQNVEKSDFYFWAHYLFAEGCRADRLMNTLWQCTPWISADGPHQVQMRADDENARDIWQSLKERRVPVHKLQTRRPELPAPHAQTPLAWLLYGEGRETPARD